MAVIPQVPRHPSGRWITSGQVAIPRQQLDGKEVDSFLAFLFEDVARRPEMLRIREVASVVRYLRLIASHGVPREVAVRGERAIEDYWASDASMNDRQARQQLESLARAIWVNLQQYGKIRPCAKRQAMRFLCAHSKTYLSGNPNLPSAKSLVENFEIPSTAQNPFRPPNFMSGSLNAQGVGNPRLETDVSERIYAAFHAAKRAGLRKVRARIASALNEAQVPRRGKATEWASEDVNDRVKEYAKRLRKNAGTRLVNDRNQLVDYWIFCFRSSREV